jgi:hypothetical protein
MVKIYIIAQVLPFKIGLSFNGILPPVRDSLRNATTLFFLNYVRIYFYVIVCKSHEPLCKRRSDCVTITLSDRQQIVKWLL